MRSAEEIGGGGPNSRGGSKIEFILRRREGGMGRGNWWMIAFPVQVPRKGKGDTGGYRSILEQADLCMYVGIKWSNSVVGDHI